MGNNHISSITGTFVDAARETEFLGSSWPLYAASLRVPLFLLSLFVVLGGYLDFVWYGLSVHFLLFMLIRLVVATALAFIAFQTLGTRKKYYFDKGVGIAQLLILGLWFSIFYDRTFFNNGGITSESFFTVLFVTYPLLVFYVIRGKILYSLVNSIIAFVAYLICLRLHPAIEVQFRVTEILVFIFFIYYSFVLQRQLNTEERKRFNGEEEQAKALHLAQQESEEKTRFIAATSHDLRQPLHALSLYIDTLDENAQTNDDTKDSIKHAKSSVTSLNDLLIALLDISKLDAGVVEISRKNFRLDSFLEKLFQNYQSIAAHKGLKLKLYTQPLTVNTDAVLLERAIANLVTNGIQHSHSGKILIACRQKGETASIEVWDQGPGIPVADLNAVFVEYHKLEKPSSADRKGLGLGLAIVKRIATALSLQLAVESKVGHGSKFSLTLPLAKSAVIEPITKASDLGSLSLKDKRILVVDDDIEVRHAMHVLLQSWGCQVLLAENQDQTMELLKIDEPPNAIISDLNLADGINGEELIMEIRKFFGKTIPATLITGNTEPDVGELAKRSEILLLYKPLRATQLRLALSRLIYNSVDTC
ncbi:MAG: ATP-binding protein [Pseudohongiellaceae bacterium]